ncbi:MAG: exodeoxyribonuclease V subunit gamma [Planctomycetes bacterium]|nr:exodeoxyribonuclease V subunit gamma [Planctomycetota bacterium]
MLDIVRFPANNEAMANKYLILGRAGSGKTHFVLNKFMDFVKEHKEKHVLFLLPTHSQVEHLKDVILKKGVVKGFLDVSFFTFSGLARWIWGSRVGSRKSGVMSEGAKDLLLKNILHKHRVKYFDEVYDSPGFRQAILKFIKELKENSLSPQKFEGILNNLASAETRTNNDPSTGRVPRHATPSTEKYAGLVSTYARFQSALGGLENNKLLDTEDLLNVLFNELKDESSLLIHKEILLVDGFHDFTPIEFKILTLLVQRIPNVYITLALDRNPPFPPLEKGGGGGIFHAASRTYAELSYLNLKEIVLHDSFRTNEPTLRHIEKNLFRKHTEAIVADDSINIIEATNIRDEVDQIARRIYALVNGCPQSGRTVRYKDIGVIFRDVDKYCDLIENIFFRYGIPVRIYAYRALRENYAIKALLNLIKVFIENWKDKWVIKVLKSDYFGLEKDLVDRFEHSALKKGVINSRKGWLALAASTPMKQVQGKQIQQFFDTLAELENGIQANQTPSFFKEWFLNVIANLLIVRKPLIPGTLSENTVKGDIAAIKTCASLLDDVVRVCEIEGIKELYFHEFIEMLLPLLDVATYSIKDKRGDVVNVIDAMEARQWELPIVFVSGLLEREFPKQVRENLFLKDRVRRELNAQNGIRLKEELRGGEEERYLFYIAVTRAREKLFLTYPNTNDTGNKNLPSFFLSEVKKLFTKDIVNHRRLSQAVHNVYDILTPKDLKDYVFYQLNAPYRKGSQEERMHGLTIWFYNQLRTDRQFIEEIRIALEDRCKAFIDSNTIIDKLKEANTCYSATQLKDYAQCPFLHFYKHILKIEKPPSLVEDGLDSIRQGVIIHKTLERYLKSKLERSEEIDILEIFEEVFDKEMKGIRIGFKELKLKGELEATIKAFIESEEGFIKLYKLSPLHLEARFGYGAQIPLIINDEEIGAIRLQGKIDRIDVAKVEGTLVGIVLDYKYSKNGFNEEEFTQGLDLQLPIYLLAARRLFNIVPIGAEFYTLKSFKRSGLINKDFVEKGVLPPEPPKNTKMLDTSQFESLMEDCKGRIVKYVKEIINGNITIEPANPDRCGSGICDFADVCRFEKWMIGKDK